MVSVVGKGLAVLFGVSLIGLALSGMLAIPSDTPASGIARLLVPLLAVLTVGLFVLRRRKAAAEGAGLLKPGSAAKLGKSQHSAMTRGVIEVLMNAKAAPDGKKSAEYLVGQEISRLTADWKAARKGQPLSPAETRSLYQLAQYALGPVSDDQREQFLKDVADPAPFFALRKKVVEIQAGKQAAHSDHAEWLATVGSTDMSHLLKDGWIAFLRSLDAPDPVLWHRVATDFHDIEACGRLEAAFWILQQPECDRATASDFIRGFVANELLETAARAGNTQRLDAFQEVIARYNSGVHTRFGIAPDADGIDPVAEKIEGPFDDVAVAGMMDRIVRETGIRPLAKPVGLLGRGDKPDAQAPATTRSPYDFWDDAGLHLRYPGPDWRQAKVSDR